MLVKGCDGDDIGVNVVRSFLHCIPLCWMGGRRMVRERFCGIKYPLAALMQAFSGLRSHLTAVSGNSF